MEIDNFSVLRGFTSNRYDLRRLTVMAIVQREIYNLSRLLYLSQKIGANLFILYTQLWIVRIDPLMTPIKHSTFSTIHLSPVHLRPNLKTTALWTFWTQDNPIRKKSNGFLPTESLQRLETMQCCSRSILTETVLYVQNGLHHTSFTCPV